MRDKVVGIAGIALLLAVSVWCLVACTKSLLLMFRSGRTFDRQLGNVETHDNPNMFGLHALGFGLLILCCALIQVGLVAFVYRHFVRI
jgi:hypothetical protein